MRKLSRKGLIKKCDSVLRDIVRKRDKCCQRCGKGDGKLEVAHFYTRSNKNIRWVETNVCLLCFRCHYIFGHGHPLEFTEFWTKRLGQQGMDLLRIKSNIISKRDYDLTLIILEKRKEDFIE